MRIVLRNAISRVWGTKDELAKLDLATSYPVEGAKFSPAFKAGHWDGREHLLRKARKEDCHLIPTGVLIGLGDELQDTEFIDERRLPSERMELEWIGKSQRDYQIRSVQEAVRDRGWETGRGLWNLPIRSGKTLTAAALIQELGLRTLFVVSSKMLLQQTLKAFQEALAPCPVAILGDGHYNTDWITIATAQTLLARPGTARELLSKADLLIIDEAHHLEGEAWRTLVLQSDASYKIGLSATVFVSRDKENNRASIWLRACTGPILYRISMERLIQQGFLKAPNVLFYQFNHAPDPRQKDWRWVAKNQIAQSFGRNKLIAQIAANAVRRGLRVHIDTGRHDQMKRIAVSIAKAGVNCEMIHGQTPSSRREELVKMLANGDICLVGTVLGEGVDIPELEVVINAEGQKSATAAIQRMRNLTIMEGKGDVYFVDIFDYGSKTLSKHSKERMRLYMGHRGFKVQECLFGDPASDPLMI